MALLGVSQAAQAAVTEDLLPAAEPATATGLAMGPQRSRAARKGGDGGNRVSSPRDSPGKLPSPSDSMA